MVLDLLGHPKTGFLAMRIIWHWERGPNHKSKPVHAVMVLMDKLKAQVSLCIHDDLPKASLLTKHENTCLTKQGG